MTSADCVTTADCPTASTTRTISQPSIATHERSQCGEASPLRSSRSPLPVQRHRPLGRSAPAGASPHSVLAPLVTWGVAASPQCRRFAPAVAGPLRCAPLSGGRPLCRTAVVGPRCPACSRAVPCWAACPPPPVRSAPLRCGGRGASAAWLPPSPLQPHSHNPQVRRCYTTLPRGAASTRQRAFGPPEQVGSHHTHTHTRSAPFPIVPGMIADLQVRRDHGRDCGHLPPP